MNETKTETSVVQDEAVYEAPQIETLLSKNDLQCEVAYAGITTPFTFPAA